MTNIFDKNRQNLKSITDSYISMIKEISVNADEVRKELLNSGQIEKIEAVGKEKAREVSLCAIDGASATEKLQSGDILTSGASFSDGFFSKRTSVDREDVSEVFMAAVMHSSDNEQILSSMRAFGEVSVLGQVEHTISIIDGAYLGNLLNVFIALQNSEKTARPILNELMNENSRKNFMEGVRLILDTQYQHEQGRVVIGVSKSDSSVTLVNKLLGDDEKGVYSNDKVLAEYMLQSGEWMLPTLLKSNNWKLGIFSETDGKYDSFRWDYREKLTKEELDCLDEVFHMCGGLYDLYADLFDQDSLYFFYFKPTIFSRGSNAIRVEISVPFAGLGQKEKEELLMERCKFVVSYLNEDFLPQIKEPYAQYEVDAFVKKPVSNSIKFLRNVLANEMVKNGLHANGVLDNYRT